MFKIRRIKLIFAFVCGISAIVVFSILLLTLFSISSMRKLETYALNLTGEEIVNSSISLFQDNCTHIAEQYSEIFLTSRNIAMLLGNAIEDNSSLDSSIIGRYTDSTSLSLSDLNGFKLNQNPNDNYTVCYYGGGDVPESTLTHMKNYLYLTYLMTFINKSYPFISESWINFSKFKYFMLTPNESSNMHNTTLANTQEYFTQKYLYYQKELKENNKKNVLWLLPHLQAVTHGWSIEVIVPIFSNHELTGFSGATIPVQLLLKYSDLSNHVDEKRTFLLSDKMDLIFFPNSYREFFGIPSPPKKEKQFNVEENINLKNINNPILKSAIATMQSKSVGYFIFNEGKMTYIIGFARIKANGWITGSIMPLSSVLKSGEAVNQHMESTITGIIINSIIISILFVLGAIFISVLFFKYLILDPIVELKTIIKQMGKGNFGQVFKTRGITELTELSIGIRILGSELIEYMENLKKEVKERLSVETEIKIAADIQKSALPKINENFKNKGFDLYSLLVPAKNVSGDFYDFFFVDNRTLALIIADVAGKGISAAFYMNMAKVVINGECNQTYDANPAKVFKKVNNIFCKNNDSGMFLTAYLLFYDIETGKISYANAGHHEIIKVKSNGECECFGMLSNMALGLMDDFEYVNGDNAIEKGDLICLYTDGASEAVNNHDEEFGTSKITDILVSNREKTSREITRILMKEIMGYQVNKKSDDITIIILKRD